MGDIDKYKLTKMEIKDNRNVEQGTKESVPMMPWAHRA